MIYTDYTEKDFDVDKKSFKNIKKEIPEYWLIREADIWDS